jgi:hypothetical protein
MKILLILSSCTKAERGNQHVVLPLMNICNNIYLSNKLENICSNVQESEQY